MADAATPPAPADLIVEVVGIDGAGKSTVVTALAARLGATARKVSPYPSAFQATVKRVERTLGATEATALRGCAVACALIHEAAEPRQGLQIFDRYVEAARMFFGVQGIRPVPDALLDRLPKPGLVILLDLDVELAMTRRLRPSHPDLSAERSYLRACTEYLRQAAASRQWLIIDASQPLDRVLADAVASVRVFLEPPEA
jgi:thymidylate kinase